MCRNIRTLFNFDPRASDEEIRASAVQYVRKISGFTKPSHANLTPFERAVEEVSQATTRLLTDLVATTPPRNRQEEAAKARERWRQREARIRDGAQEASGTA